jgi:hypothetical protein
MTLSLLVTNYGFNQRSKLEPESFLGQTGASKTVYYRMNSEVFISFKGEGKNQKGFLRLYEKID